MAVLLAVTAPCLAAMGARGNSNYRSPALSRLRETARIHDHVISEFRIATDSVAACASAHDKEVNVAKEPDIFDLSADEIDAVAGGVFGTTVVTLGSGEVNGTPIRVEITGGPARVPLLRR